MFFDKKIKEQKTKGMKTKICKLILIMLGWNVKNVQNIKSLKKYVIIAAPYTSAWDFIIGKLILVSLNVKCVIIIKKESFVFPIGIILRYMGAISVDRQRGATIVSTAVRLLEENDNFSVIITPEGTRKKQNNWKMGFYCIAQRANVPILVASLDYSKKESNFETVFYPTGDLEKDFKEIKSYYVGKKGKYPENFNLWFSRYQIW